MALGKGGKERVYLYIKIKYKFEEDDSLYNTNFTFKAIYDFRDIGKIIFLGTMSSIYDFVNYGNDYLISDLILRARNPTKIERKLSTSTRNISDALNMNYLIDLRRGDYSL